MPEKPLRSAVVGLRMGAGHARVMNDLDDYDVTAICDIDEETTRKVAADLGDVSIYTDYDEMLAAEEPEVVAVATPNTSHAELTVKAAHSGARGICCEKPIATCMDEAREMLAACREHGTRLIVNHQRRMSRPLVRMRQLIEQGAIGELYLLRGTCAGDILSDGTHLVDSLRWLAGDEEVRWVLGQVYREAPPEEEGKAAGYHVSGGYRYGHPVETGGMAVFEFESGVRAEILCGEARFPRRNYQDYEVFGTKGRLWRQGDRAEPPVLIWDEEAGGWRGVEDAERSSRREPMRESYAAFAEFIRRGGEHPLSGESGARDLEVIMAVYESARANSKVEMPLEQGAFPLELMLAKR
ncbi:MAG: Gfo/Idh/MocA family oxidoreductase [Candidatus Brocadiia bacterium]